MRPNDKGSSALVSQAVLKAQVQELLLSDMVHLSSGTKAPYRVAWSSANFEKRYSGLMTPFDVRKLIDSVGGQGRVGSEAVYGTQELQKALDEKAQALSGKKPAASEKTQTPSEKKQVPPLPFEQLDKQKEKLRNQEKPEATDKAAHSLNLGASSIPSEKRAELQKMAKSDLRSRAMASGVSQAALLGALDADDTKAALVELILAAEASRAPHAQRPRDLQSRPPHASPPSSSSDDDFGKQSSKLGVKGNRGPLRSMALPQHATLHSALSQMAAVLRVAKESEAKLREAQTSRNSEAQELRQECDAWRIEADRLWVQVKDLQQIVQETNLWRPPHST